MVVTANAKREGYVYYGHDPIGAPFLPRISHGFDKTVACGLDTSCVFGGKLTAAVVTKTSDLVRTEYVSVSAKQQYCEPLKALEE